MTQYSQKDISVISGHEARACFCVGRQNGEPCCPCEMRARGIFKPVLWCKLEAL